MPPYEKVKNNEYYVIQKRETSQTYGIMKGILRESSISNMLWRMLQRRENPMRKDVKLEYKAEK